MVASTAKKKSAPLEAPAAKATAAALPLMQFAQGLRRWTDTVLGVGGSAAELSLNLAQARAQSPKQRAAVEKAGSLLRKSREAAGMTTAELGRAIDLDDPALLEQAERGQAGLPVEVILRLASVLGRHDPTSYALKLARTTNPQLWKALDDFGIGRMFTLAGREREMANLYRGNDAARHLSDEDFAQVLLFAKTAFDMAVGFRTPGPAKAKRAA